jgi:fatty-acyl-CoA synthase
VTRESVSELFERAAAGFAQREAIVLPAERVTYAQLHERSRRRMGELAALGVRPGDHVGLLAANSIAYVELLLAIAALGAISVPINARFRRRELGHVVRNGDLRALVVSTALDDHAGVIGELFAALPGLADAADPVRLELADAPLLRAVAALEDEAPAGVLAWSRLRELGAGAPPPEVRPAGPDDVGMILYTSGTTANPKGCLLTHDGMTRNAHNFAAVFELAPDDRFWDPLPMFHGAAIEPMLGALSVGAAYLTMPFFEVEAAARQLRDERATVVYSLFPPVTMALLHDPRLRAGLPSARAYANLSPPDVQRQVQQLIAPARLVNAYGITEATALAVFSAPTDSPEQVATTCGSPFPGVEARIVDVDSGRVLAPGERGELQLRGYNVFRGYYNDPEATARTLDADGWLHTGDVCSLDDDGRVAYHGRDKDMLKVGGENVSALEVESVLGAHPAVKLAQVVGAPDERLQEVVAAFVELAPGASVSEQELVDYCATRIARFKVPRHVRFVEEWPMSATKVQKFRLRDRIAAELRSAATTA